MAGSKLHHWKSTGGGETNALNPLPMTVCHPTDNAWGKQRVTGHRTRSNISRNIREKNTVTQCSVDIHDLLNSLPKNKANNNGETGSRNWKPECLIKLKLKKRSFLDAIASPSSYPCLSVSESVSQSVRNADQQKLRERGNGKFCWSA